MKEIIQIVMSMYDSYNGTGMQMALFFASLIYLIVYKKDKDKKYLFLGYTLLFFIVCFCPVTAKIIMNVCIGQEVYWLYGGADPDADREKKQTVSVIVYDVSRGRADWNKCL